MYTLVPMQSGMPIISPLDPELPITCVLLHYKSTTIKYEGGLIDCSRLNGEFDNRFTLASMGDSELAKLAVMIDVPIPHLNEIRVLELEARCNHDREI